MGSPNTAVPQYKLLQPAYIDDVLYDQAKIDSEKGAIIFYQGVPGPHMEPLNAAAKKMVEQHPFRTVDPINAMTAVGAQPAPAAA